MALFSSNSQRDHKFAATNLSAYLDGALSPDQAERVSQHLAVCEACRRDLALLQRTIALLQAAPMRPVPRSFALPRSAQAEQASYRRWNGAYGMLRTASVVVSLLLVLFFSGDALFGQWMAPTFAPSPPVERAVEEREAVLEAPVARAPAKPEAPVVHEAVEAPKREAPAPMALAPSVEITVLVEKQVERAMPAMAPGVGGGAESAPSFKPGAPPGSMPKTSGARAVGAPPPPQPVAEGATPAGAAPEGVMLIEAPSPEKAAAEAHQDMAPTPDATAPADLPTLGWTPPQTPAETRLVALEALGTPLPDVAEAPPARVAERGPSPLWTIWRGVRVVSGVLLGMLLMLVAALVWVGQKRRL